MPTPQLIPASLAEIGAGMHVRRALPTRHRRLVGAWCFLDHFGPAKLVDRGMRVGPHPHIGLQTVTWLLQGSLMHSDSLGTLQPIEPGALNLMTAGHGISHAEVSPESRPPEVHGVQFWIALPESARNMPPEFHHYPKVPVVSRDGMRISVLAGELLGEKSPAKVHTPLMGASIEAPAGSKTVLPLRADWEYGAIVTHGEATVTPAKAGVQLLTPGNLLYLGEGNTEVSIAAGPTNTGIVLVGGEPFQEQILMWWNFVARTKGEITKACGDWNNAAPHLGEVKGDVGARLVAPMPPWLAHGPEEVVKYP